MNQVQLETCVLNMFNKSGDYENFVQEVRDLLIQLKEFAQNQDELYQPQKEVSFSYLTDSDRLERRAGEKEPIAKRVRELELRKYL